MHILQIISGLDAGITAMFGVEALVKITAFTFVAYIRVNSNKVGSPSVLFCRQTLFRHNYACFPDEGTEI